MNNLIHRNTSLGRLYNIMFLLCLLFLPLTAFGYDMGAMDVVFTCGLKETYDDNITFAENNKKSDFITSVNLGATAKHDDRQQSFGFSGFITPNFYSRYDNFDNVTQDYGAYFTRELSKSEKLNLNDSFSHSEEPRSFEEELGRSTGRYSINNNMFEIGYSRDITRQLSILAKYNHEVTWYSRNDLTDSWLNSASFETDYALNSNTIILGSYEYSRRDFDHISSNVVIQTAAGGLRQYLTSKLYLDAKAGLNFVDPITGKNTAKPFYLFSITDEIDNNTQARVSFRKDYSTSAYSSDIFDSWQGSVDLSRKLSERLSGSGSLYHGQGKYITIGIKDKVSGVRFGASYDLTKDIKANIGYSYSQTSSNISTREYKKNMVTAGLTAAF